MFRTKLKHTIIYSVRKKLFNKKKRDRTYTCMVRMRMHVSVSVTQYSSNARLAWICTAISSPPIASEARTQLKQLGRVINRACTVNYY